MDPRPFKEMDQVEYHGPLRNVDVDGVTRQLFRGAIGTVTKTSGSTATVEFDKGIVVQCHINGSDEFVLGPAHRPKNTIVSKKPAEPRIKRQPDQLSRREQQVFDHVIQGKPNLEIAAALSMSTKTVDTHINRILRKTGLESRFEARLYGVLSGQADIPEAVKRLIQKECGETVQ